MNLSNTLCNLARTPLQNTLLRAWACLKRVGPEVYGMTTASPSVKVCMLKAEVIETPKYGCVTWTISAKHFAKFRTVHHQVLLRIIGFQRRRIIDQTTLLYTEAIGTTRCEGIDSTIRHRRVLLAGAVVRQTRGRLRSRVVCGDDQWGGPETGRAIKHLA